MVKSPKKRQNKAERDRKILRTNREVLLDRVVIILGGYEKIDLLQAIQTELERMDFVPIVPGVGPFKELNYSETPRQKLHGYTSNAKFVLVEDSKPSGAIIELEYCRHVGVITPIIFEELSSEITGRSTFMTLDLEVHSKDFKSFRYMKTDMKSIRVLLKKVLFWVKNREKERQREFQTLKKTVYARSS